MTKRAWITTTALLFAMSQFGLFAQDPAFFRLELVNYSKEDAPTEVKIRLPLSLAESFRPAVEEALVGAHLDPHLEIVRQSWAEIRAAGPFHMLELQHEGQTVNVFTTEANVEIRGDFDDLGETVITIPLAIGDVFLANDKPLSFDGILNTLRDLRGTSLVDMQSDRVDLRVWID